MAAFVRRASEPIDEQPGKPDTALTFATHRGTDRD
jgi:hypothetical protein